MLHAIIVTGGKQYRVGEGDVVFVEKLGAEAGEEVVFDNVLAVVGDGVANFGAPTVAGAKVTIDFIAASFLSPANGSGPCVEPPIDGAVTFRKAISATTPTISRLVVQILCHPPLTANFNRFISLTITIVNQLSIFAIIFTSRFTPHFRT